MDLKTNDLSLNVKDLNVIYKTERGDLQAVRDVSFNVKKNESIAFIGESGCGKTTLFLAITRLLANSARIKNGEVCYWDRNDEFSDILKLSGRELLNVRWRNIAMMFQASQNAFNPVIKIKEHFIDTVKSHSNVRSKKILEKGRELLQLVDLDPQRVLNSYPHELSGGMKQRVLLAMCFLLNPEIIIMDEPTTALDVLTQRNVINSIKKLKKDFGFALIIITHDLATAAELVDTVATMYAGKLVEKGPVDEMFYASLHPYTRGLIKAVPTVKTDFKELSSIPGTPPDLINVGSGCSFAPRCQFSEEKCFNKEPDFKKVNKSHGVACFNYKKVMKESGDYYA